MELTTADGTQIYWCVDGEGRDVALTHTLFADHRLYGGVTRRLVAHGHRVIRWDLPAHGRSTRPNGALPFEAIAGHLRAVLDAARVHAPVLIGHGVGALLSAAVARDVGASALSLWAPDLRPNVHRAARMGVFAARRFAMRPVARAIEPWMSRTGHALAGLQRRANTTLSPSAVGDVLNGLAPLPDLDDLLAGLPIPIQRIGGAGDTLTRSSGHLVHLDASEGVEAALLAFLSGRAG